MTALRLTLRAAPEQRLDLSALTPDRLADLSVVDIEKLPLHTTRRPAHVGDVFSVHAGDAARVVIEGGSSRFDLVGAGMTQGEVIVDGDAGMQAGRALAGGRLTIHGHAGPFAASGLRGGHMEIKGDAGAFLGGALAGERTGMRGGTVIVRGNAGDRAADRLRRGLIVVQGNAGAYPGSRMIAGTLIVCGTSGPLPGYLMRRGTLVLGDGAALPPTFLPVEGSALVFTRLLVRALSPLSELAASLADRARQRYAGDMAVLGKGEVFAIS